MTKLYNSPALNTTTPVQITASSSTNSTLIESILSFQYLNSLILLIFTCSNLFIYLYCYT